MTLTYRGLAVLLTSLPRLRTLSPCVSGSVEEVEEFRRTHPRLNIILSSCGNPAADRESRLEERWIRRQGPTDRLSLAWNRYLSRGLFR